LKDDETCIKFKGPFKI